MHIAWVHCNVSWYYVLVVYVDIEPCLWSDEKRCVRLSYLFLWEGISNLSQRWIGWEIIHINELHILYSLLFQTKICRKKTKDNFSGKQNTSKIKMYFFLFFLQIHVKNKHILYNHASITALQIYLFHLSGHQTKFNVWKSNVIVHQK